MYTYHESCRHQHRTVVHVCRTWGRSVCKGTRPTEARGSPMQCRHARVLSKRFGLLVAKTTAPKHTNGTIYPFRIISVRSVRRRFGAKVEVVFPRPSSPTPKRSVPMFAKCPRTALYIAALLFRANLVMPKRTSAVCWTRTVCRISHITILYRQIHDGRKSIQYRVTRVTHGIVPTQLDIFNLLLIYQNYFQNEWVSWIISNTEGT